MMDRERIIQVFFFGFLALMAYELYVLLAPFITPLMWAILLAFLAHPLLIELDHLVRRRSLSAIIITLAVALGVILPAIWLSGRLAAEAQNLYVQAATMLNADGLARARDWMLHSDFIQAINRRLAPRGIKIEDEIPKHAAATAQIVSAYVAYHLTTAARNVATVVIDFGIILLIFFYLLRDGESYYNSLRDLTPLHEDDKKAVFETLRSTLASVMRGLMLTALLQGVTIGVGLMFSGVPYWAFLALASAAAGLLPIGGTAVIWVPATLYLFYTAGWGWAIFLVVWCSIALAIIDNFIKPMAMKHGTGLPTLALFFGIAGGLEAYGPIGLFVGPAIMSVFAALLRVYRKTYGESRKQAA
ncbi:MAG TPA: AI-2E family transporter [Candidatus Binataceae bacterium]|nr:AI-2E family transporter [Candidatus Binataceae bacterium]